MVGNAQISRGRAIDLLLRQFRTTLAAQVKGIEVDSGQGDVLRKEMLSLLGSDDFTWEDANFIEQSVVQFYPDEKVDIEVDRLRVQAKMIMDPEVASFYIGINPDKMTPRSRRYLLCRIVSDLQLEVQKRIVRRNTLHTICKKLVFYISICFVVLLCSETVLKQMSTLTSLYSIHLGNEGVVIFRVLVIALSSGAIGAAMSVLIRLTRFFNSSRLRDIETFSHYIYLVNRMFIGAVGGVVGCFLVNENYISIFNMQHLFCDTRVNVFRTVVVGIVFGFWEFFLPTTLGKLQSDEKKQAKA